MMLIEIEEFKNICKKCSTEFRTWHLPANTYGHMLVGASTEEVAFIFPSEDFIWEEIEGMIDRVPGVDAIRETERTNLFDQAIQLTMDPSPSGADFYIWGRF